ncbi:MAG: 3-phosphoshikimate 1-carboxyvinyltransferase [Alteromonadaceae bacterium]|jgi:3-phosphoshikimate 1-carboxyvinyltransferase|uniref:3-phosphoshikimate 1-carboxyvinyltransferase n=1 Tax=Rheinheimera aquimaris TaxID=412437 RepID=UPI000C6B13CE|nr:3-phosphoshikimate 1-carboxyvinyltransferase [Rheinheimera aquimaris]MBJ92464.1 3-phosphoshikimate 1-carboxyvinyltransferase [Alteromonadaceae bacterium]MCD1599439.1 3-phosphoshikimate 1-carboxyvinyltransferase [Rheinheimera aquimaris]HBN88984.1 3-phosphoshikimate 1-carboxyvinyltransferase [Rheinheimera sp.]|tara:strand:+ start:4774 stop:6054 length:1281 start_codon:yes stop_codon:yes gene_type:complete
MKTLTLEPIAKVNGEVHLPGSKSISNRVLLLAALAEGTTQISNLLDSDDVRHMLNALTSLGVNYTLSPCRTECKVQGLGGLFSHPHAITLFLGNAGTAMRPLTAALAASSVDVTLTGEPRMYERPIGHLVDALQQWHAEINYLQQDGFPPLRIKGQPLNGGTIKIDGSISSQFLTAVLMVAPLLNGNSEIEIIGELVSKPYIDITLALMQRFGVDVVNHGYQRFSISGNQQYRSPGKWLVEGDASSASYFLAAAAIKGGSIKVTGIGKHAVQGDIHFADALEAMGADVEWADDYIKVTRNKLIGIDRDYNAIPDAAMTIATAALFAEGPTVIRNVYNWRVKETDRLAAMATELRKVGAEVEEGHDYLKIVPPSQLKHASIATYNDHRMAMCFSLVALSDTAVTIEDPDCTAKTFPDYFSVFQQLAR